MDFSFFITDNKSGYKTKESWVKKNHPGLYDEIISYGNNFNFQMSFKEKIWFFFNKLTDRPKCKNCGKYIAFRERFDKPYGEFCSIDCFNSNKEEMINRIVETNKKKYGVDFYTKTTEFVEKTKTTKKKKYGDENYNNVEKMKSTKEKKYGDKNYNNLEKYRKTCLFKYDVTNYSKSNSYKTKIVESFKQLYPLVNFVDVRKTDVSIKCDVCCNTFEINKQLLYERNKRNYVLCTTCNPIGMSNRSNYELELSSFLTENNIEHQVSKKLPSGKEIDIYIPSIKLGIEINGLYWHNELFVDSFYHLNKTLESKKQDVNLIHIFEDEWLYKKEIVLSIIKNRLSLNDNIIYARKCNIKEIPTELCKKFMDDNHIQGNVNSKIKLGLFFNEELVSVMSFSKGRVIMGGKEDEWELNRFSSKLNCNVVGAAGKLLKFFIEKYQPKKIISYSDVRLFDGGMYEKIGFEYKSQSKPNYWYVIQNKRFYRFNFRKSVLVKQGYDKNKTEKEIMFENKQYRIYDCGNIRWEMTLH